MTKTSKPIVLQCHWSVDCNAFVAKAGKATYIIWIDEDNAKSKKKSTKKVPKQAEHKVPRKQPSKQKFTKSRKEEIIAMIKSGLSKSKITARFPLLDRTKLSKLYQDYTTPQPPPQRTPPSDIEQYPITEPDHHQGPREASTSNPIPLPSATPSNRANFASDTTPKYPPPPSPRRQNNPSH